MGGAGCFDPLSLIVLVPLVILAIIFVWAIQKKSRATIAIKASYIFIALDLVLFLIVPVCSVPFPCYVWTLVPLVMFGMLIFFLLRRFKHDYEHEKRLVHAMVDGHIDPRNVSEVLAVSSSKKQDKKASTQEEKKEKEEKPTEVKLNEVEKIISEAKAANKKRKVAASKKKKD